MKILNDPVWYKRILAWSAIVIGGCLFFKFFLPFVLPLLIGVLIACMMEPAVKVLQSKFRLPRFAGAGLVMVLGIGAGIFLIHRIVRRILAEAGTLIDQAPRLMGKLSSPFQRWQENITAWIQSMPPPLKGTFESAYDQVLKESSALPGEVYNTAAGWIPELAGSLPSAILFLFTLILSAFLISGEYPRLSQKALNLFPEALSSKVLGLKNQTIKTLGKWAKAQGIMMGLTFLLLLSGFAILRLDAIFVPALLISLIDALPVLGLGICLLPWAGVAFLTGDIETAIGLLIVYGTAVVIRGVLEPKLIGSQLGMKALTTVAAMYIGFKAGGVVGIILFPIFAVVGKQIWLSFSDRPPPAS
ncbi:MAG: sporulation integral membrane protein YtvI [Oscillospiraceae bacterium]|nr:sporulation integral membrane protein YtvI [Oscillospiraceae bacterium]